MGAKFAAKHKIAWHLHRLRPPAGGIAFDFDRNSRKATIEIGAATSIVLSEASRADHEETELLGPGSEARSTSRSSCPATTNPNSSMIRSTPSYTAPLQHAHKIRNPRHRRRLEGQLGGARRALHRRSPRPPHRLRRNGANRGLAQNYVDAAFLGKGKYYRLICGDNAEPLDTITSVFDAHRRGGHAPPLLCDGRGQERLSPVAIENLFVEIVNMHQRHQDPLLQRPRGASASQRDALASDDQGFWIPGRDHLHASGRGATYVEIPVHTVELKAANHARSPQRIGCR